MGMGRRKIAIERVADPKKQQITFNKRKVGLMRKAMELSILTECEMAVLCFRQGKLLTYSSNGSLGCTLRRAQEFIGEAELLDDDGVSELRPGKMSQFRPTNLKAQLAQETAASLSSFLSQNLSSSSSSSSSSPKAEATGTASVLGGEGDGPRINAGALLSQLTLAQKQALLIHLHREVKHAIVSNNLPATGMHHHPLVDSTPANSVSIAAPLPPPAVHVQQELSVSIIDQVPMADIVTTSTDDAKHLGSDLILSASALTATAAEALSDLCRKPEQSQKSDDDHDDNNESQSSSEPAKKRARTEPPKNYAPMSSAMTRRADPAKSSDTEPFKVDQPLIAIGPPVSFPWPNSNTNTDATWSLPSLPRDLAIAQSRFLFDSLPSSSQASEEEDEEDQASVFQAAPQPPTKESSSESVSEEPVSAVG